MHIRPEGMGRYKWIVAVSEYQTVSFALIVCGTGWGIAWAGQEWAERGRMGRDGAGWGTMGRDGARCDGPLETGKAALSAADSGGSLASGTSRMHCFRDVKKRHQAIPLNNTYARIIRLFGWSHAITSLTNPSHKMLSLRRLINTSLPQD